MSVATRWRALAVATAVLALVLISAGGQPPAARTEAATPTAAQAAPSAPSEPSAVAPSGASPAAAHVARVFVVAYLAYSYGHASTLPGSTEALRTRLLADPPRVPAAVRHRRPRLTALTLVALSGTEDRVLATVGDGVTHYPIELDLTLDGTRWQVDDIDPQAF